MKRNGFFQKIYNKPTVCDALFGQTQNTLRPFSKYLHNAIETAKKKHVVAKVTWRKVNPKYQIQVQRRYTEILFGSRENWWKLGESLSEEEYQAIDCFFLRKRRKTLGIVDKRRSEGTVALCFDEALEGVVEGTLFFKEDRFEERTVRLWNKKDEPHSFQTLSGESLPLKRCVFDEKSQHWKAVLDVQWNNPPNVLVIDGATIEIQVQSTYPNILVAKDTRIDRQSGQNYFGGRSLQEGLELWEPNNPSMRYSVQKVTKLNKNDLWIELLLPDAKEISSDLYVDPRLLFFEDSIREIWEQERYQKNSIVRVFRTRKDKFQLKVKRYPRQDCKYLYLPVNTRNLYLQQRAVRQLMKYPLPAHRGLLKLCEKPESVRWGKSRREMLREDEYLFLSDLSFQGTDEQRSFVNKALNSPDLAILEGPPGSGKTRVICELAYQLLRKGKRILICSTTNVAVDNVLERLMKQTGELVVPVRLGKEERIDSNLHRVQLDDQVQELLEHWEKTKAFGDVENRKALAQRAVLMKSNVIGATTMGIANYPLLRDTKGMLCQQTHFDVVILDEASKTTISEFLVPALLAKKWVVVGDVHQLPPFNDREEVKANIESIAEFSGTKLSLSDQRALFLYWFLFKKSFRKREAVLEKIATERCLIVEKKSVLAYFTKLLGTLSKEERVRFRGIGSFQYIRCLSPKDVKKGKVLALQLGQHICVAEEDIEELAPHLPGNCFPTRDVKSLSWQYKHACFVQKNPDRKKLGKAFMEALERSWAGEIAWRLIRKHELARSIKQGAVKKYEEEIQTLIEPVVQIKSDLSLIQDIGLPSIIEVVQKGLGRRKQRPSILNLGFFNPEYLSKIPPVKRKELRESWNQRFVSLSFQHRMHPEISRLPREMIYEGKSLNDGSYVQNRDQGWHFKPHRQRHRSLWIRSNWKDQGFNQREIENMMEVLRQFKRWAQSNAKKEGVWEVACLSFYVKQMQGIEAELKKWCDRWEGNRGFVFHAGTETKMMEIVWGTVDRFQGREADMVLLSMRNNRRVGFLDSTHRLNVAITRAREQLCVFGNQEYFKKQSLAEELQEFASKTKFYSKRRG